MNASVVALAVALTLGQSAVRTGTQVVGNGTKVQATGSTTARSLAARFADVANVKDFGAVGDGVANDTGAFQAALNTGKSVYAPGGVYLVDELTIPLDSVGRRIYGDGFSHWSSSTSTVIKARTAAQGSVFKLAAAGVDNVTLVGMRIEGDHKAVRGLDARLAGFFSLEEVGVYNCTAYGIDSGAGLARLRRVFASNDAVGLRLFSDSTVADSEFTGGTIPVMVVAGGNSFTNVWMNSGSVTNLRIAPLDDSTGVANNKFLGIYVGEVHDYSGTVRASVEIVGTAVQKVQQTHFAGSHFVHAEATQATYVNGLVTISRAVDVTFVGNTFRGMSSSSLPGRHTDYAVATTVSVDGLVFSGNAVRGINRNALTLTDTQGFTVSGNTFVDNGVNWNAVIAAGHYSVAGDDGANLLITDSSTYGGISGNAFFYAGTYPYAVKAPNSTLASAWSNVIRGGAAPAYVFTNGPAAGTRQTVGEAPFPRAPSVAADRGDTNQTLVSGIDAPVQRWATTLTANRTVTLSTTNAANGDTFRIVRTGLGAFTLDVGGLKTIPSATAAYVDVAYNGSAWVLTGYGAL